MTCVMMMATALLAMSAAMRLPKAPRILSVVALRAPKCLRRASASVRTLFSYLTRAPTYLSALTLDCSWKLANADKPIDIALKSFAGIVMKKLPSSEK